MICALDEKFPEVRKEIQQLADNIGADYDTARIIYETNNGHSLDKAPNGAESRLYNDLLSHYNGDVRQALIAKAKLYLKPFREWFGDWTAEDKTDVSKVVDENGEPLVVYHQSTASGFSVFNLNESNKSKDRLNSYSFHFGTKLAAEQVEILGQKGDLFQVFLNIKNPINLPDDVQASAYNTLQYFYSDQAEEKYGRKLSKDLFDETREILNDYYTSPEDKRIAMKKVFDFMGFDGIFYKNQVEDVGSLSQAVLDPNQVKSVDNRGTYSTTDNNIYKSLKKSKNTYAWLSKQGLISPYYKYRNGEFPSFYYISPIVENNDAQLFSVQNSIRTHAQQVGKNVEFIRNVETGLLQVRLYDQALDRLQSDKGGTTESARQVLTFLQERFPSLKFEIIPPSDKIPENQNAWVDGDTIYLVEGRFTDEIAIEEALHPFVATIFNDNPQLFKELFDEAKAAYPKLWGQILNTYIQEGITDSTRQMELVTQALSREFNKEHKANKPIPYREFAKKFLDAVRRLLISASNYVLGKNNISIEELPKMKLSEVAKMINTSDTQFRVYYNGRFNSLGSVASSIASTVSGSLGRANKLSKIEQEFEVVKKGLEARLKALKYYKNKNLYQIRTTDKLIKELHDLDAKQGMLAFYRDACLKLKDALEFLQKDAADINFKQLVQLQRDLLGFYLPSLNSMKDYLNEFSDVEDFVNDYWTVYAQAGYVESLYHNMIVQKATEAMVKNAREKGFPEEEIQEIEEYMANPLNDVSAIASFVGTYQNSSNKIIRMARRIVGDQQNETARNTYNRGRKLVDLHRKAKQALKDPLESVETLLQEKDKDGMKTGYIVRPINYGQFNSDLKVFTEKLYQKYGIELDENKVPIFESREQEIKFRNDLDTWKCKHAERRYKLSYYLAKNEHLSQLSREALDNVEREIHDILAHITTDRVHIEKFKGSDMLRYNQLIKQKQALYSFDYPDGTPKSGEDLQIATELNAFRDELNGKVKYKVDYTRFEAERQRVADEYGEDSVEYKQWIYTNTEIAYSEEYYDSLSHIASFNPINQLTSPAAQAYRKLIRKRADILKYYRSYRSLVPDITTMPPEVIETIKSLDKEISDLYYQLKQEVKDADIDTSGNPSVDEISQTGTTQYYKDRLQQAKDALPLDPDAITKFVEETTFEDASGKIRTYSLYEYRFPKYKKDILFEKPNKFWQQLDMESEWANPDYDQSSGEYMQPKKDLYDNSAAYNKIQSVPEIKALYDAILETMSESNDKIGFLNSSDNYKLPQISGRLMTVLRGKSSILHKLGHYAKDEMNIRNDDVDYNETEGIRPDGSKIYHVPTRFIQMLEDTDTITDDVVGSVIQYFQMAEDFNNKSQVLDELEMFRYFLEPEIQKSSKRSSMILSKDKFMAMFRNTYAARKYAKFLEMNLYGIKKKNAKVFGWNASKSIQKFFNYVSWRNLGWNIHPALSGTIAALGLHNLEAVMGKYYTQRDRNFASHILTTNLVEIMANIGNVDNKNKLIQIMQLNQICRNNNETFKDLDMNQIQRAIYQNAFMGGFSAGDFILKSQIVLSVYNNYRLVDDPVSGEKKFMSFTQFAAQYHPGDRHKAEEEFYKFRTNLYDAYGKDKDGNLTVKDEYKGLVTKTLVNEVTNKAQQLSSRADGTLSDLDKAEIHQNVITQFTTQHRNFMILGYESMFGGRKFNYQTMEYEHGRVAAASKLLWRCIRNFNKANMQEQWGNATFEEKYAVKYLSILFSFIIASSLLMGLLKDAADEDKDNWWLQFAAYDLQRSVLELSSIYNPIETNNIIKSIAPATGVIDNSLKLVKFWDWNERVERGAYKGMRHWQRDIIKLTPFKNAYEISSPQAIRAKRQYLENQLLF